MKSKAISSPAKALAQGVCVRLRVCAARVCVRVRVCVGNLASLNF